MSSLTLGLAVERLPDTVYPISEPPQSGFDGDAALRNDINRVNSRFHDEGKWAGLITQATINAFSNGPGDSYITTPRHLAACISSGKKGHIARRIQSEWYQFLPGGTGVRVSNKTYCGPLQDKGEGYVVFRDIPEPANLVIRTTEVEDNYSEIIIKALDDDGHKIYSTYQGATIEGLAYDLADAPINIALNISKVYGVTKSVTSGHVQLFYVDGADEVLIGDYEPGERVISYRRYLVPDGQEAVTGIFKRRHQWAYSDNDVLYPDNLEALKLGLLALNNEEKADIERAQFYMDKAINLLNSELREYFSGLEGSAQFESWVTGGILNVN